MRLHVSSDESCVKWLARRTCWNWWRMSSELVSAACVRVRVAGGARRPTTVGFGRRSTCKGELALVSLV
eukprot:6180692-Pleurochrysis_carterae.AAC.1